MTQTTSGYDLDGSSAAANAIQADYKARSDIAATLPGARLDLAYGDDPRHRLDVFSAGPDAPALVFFHGGYWKAGSKDSRRFPATAWRVKGVSWVTVNYRLVPEHSLEDAIADARSAVAWLAANAADLGIDADQLHVSGNSAGGHLSAMVASAQWPDNGPKRPDIRSLTAVSGLFDAIPLLETNANSWLTLTPARAQQTSPIHHMPPADLPLILAWGGDETPEFEWQSRLYGEAADKAGNPVTYHASPGDDHFQIIGRFDDPESSLFCVIAQMMGV